MLKQINTCLLKSNFLSYQGFRYKSKVTRVVSKKHMMNAGLRRQIEALKEGPDDLDLNAFETDELESDFMNLEYVHKEHVDQMQKLKEREKLLIVRQKYFKQKFPNFLTWYDKDQIKYLHKTNKEEWTIEALSEGFPALPETIKKIVNASWTKKDPAKVVNHDNSVKKNWEMFQNGQLEVPPNLTNHLNKFTNRNHIYYDESQRNVENIKKPKYSLANGEFADIIKSYERIKYKTEEIVEEKKQLPQPKEIKKVQEETYFIPNKSNQHNITLENLKSSLEEDISLGKSISGDDKIMLQELNTKKAVEDILQDTAIIDLKDISKVAYLTVNNTTIKDDKHLRYPEKIIIPKEKLKRGYTYKLNDCYYDSDGLFLYRVPGMEK